MKQLIAILGISLSISTSLLAAPTYRVIPFDGYQEADGLPPRLEVTYQLRCYQQFVRVIRNDETNAMTGKVTIAVGILVREDESVCNSAYDKTVDAGTTYSGREFEVVSIQ